MLTLKKVLSMPNSPYKSTKRRRSTSFPLRQLTYVESPANSGAYNTRTPGLPAEIWFLILESLDYQTCIFCGQELLCILSLVSRVFNEFATKALYQTLDLRFSGECKEPHPFVKKLHWYPKPHITKDHLKKKLDRLNRTLRLSQGPVLLIRHLKLPEISITKHPNYAQNIFDILPNWVMIFELCSSRLESATGLGSLWSYLHHFDKSGLRNRLCNAIEGNPHWTHWDWRWASWGYAWWSAVTEEPRILEMYRGWKNIHHVSLDTAEWAAITLDCFPELCSLSIECGDRMCDFSTLFQHVPLKGLKSLTIKAWIPPQEIPAPRYDNTEPLNPLIDYLKRCHQQQTPSQYLSFSVLTNLDIDCFWTESNVFNPGYHYPKMVCVDEFLYSIFTLAPLLQRLNIAFKTPHEEEIALSAAAMDDSIQSMAHQTTDFVARHLRSMAISLPSRNSKVWLASKIASGAFPKLSSFVFRSAMTRRELACPTMFCECTLAISDDFLASNHFGRKQDAALVKACLQAGVREWEMQILHINSHPCFSFTIEDMIEDPRSLYYAKEAHIGFDKTRMDHLGRANGQKARSSGARSRGIICDIRPYETYKQAGPGTLAIGGGDEQITFYESLL